MICSQTWILKMVDRLNWSVTAKTGGWCYLVVCKSLRLKSFLSFTIPQLVYFFTVGIWRNLQFELNTIRNLNRGDCNPQQSVTVCCQVLLILKFFQCVPSLN